MDAQSSVLVTAGRFHKQPSSTEKCSVWEPSPPPKDGSKPLIVQELFISADFSDAFPCLMLSSPPVFIQMVFAEERS